MELHCVELMEVGGDAAQDVLVGYHHPLRIASRALDNEMVFLQVDFLLTVSKFFFHPLKLCIRNRRQCYLEVIKAFLMQWYYASYKIHNDKRHKRTKGGVAGKVLL